MPKKKTENTVESIRFSLGELIKSRNHSMDPTSSDESDKAEEPKNDYCEWIVRENNTFYPTAKIIKTEVLPAGFYKIEYNSKDGYFVSKHSIFTDELLNLPIKDVDNIINDIKKFWNRESIFQKYNFVHKRGVLLWGPAGCGKSCVLQRLVKQIIEEQNGIVFSLSNHNDLERYVDFIPDILRSIEPDRPIITIMEDLDGLLSHYENETLVLNVLDGMKQSRRIVYVATTNYPEKLKERILNRPSRFDRRYKIGYPDAKVREFYFVNKLKPEDLKKIDLKKWVADSKGFSIAHLREMIASVIILGNTFEETMKHLKELSNIPSSTEDRKSNLGFKTDEDEEY